jgi:hypothetical protein
MKLFKAMLLGALAFSLVACSQVGGGLKTPTLKQELSQKNSLVPSAAALTMSAQNYCNAQSQVDYAALVLYCEGKAPALPLSISTTYATSVSQFSCQVYGYTNSSNQLVVPATVALGGCASTESGVPAPTAAPSPAVTAAPVSK